jgi:hypothetical protein
MRGQITQQLFIRGSGPVLGHGWHLSRAQASKPLTGKAHYRHCGLVRGRNWKNHSKWYT